MESVRPTGTSGRGRARMASTATRCAAARRVATAARERDVRLARREHAGVPAHGRHDVGLVDGAGARHHVAQAPRSTAAQNRPKRSTAPSLSQPPCAVSQSGVVKWWNVTTGSTPRPAQPEALAAVVGQRGAGDLPLRRLDAAPLHREAVVVEARPATRSASSSQRSHESQASPDDSMQPEPGVVLELPPVVVGVAALDLVRRRRRAPCEPPRERPSRSVPTIDVSPRWCWFPGGTVSFPDDGVTFLADD